MKFLTLALFISTSILISSPSMVFLNPGSKDDTFFKMMSSFMQLIADQYGIDFKIIYCDRDHRVLQDKGMKLLNRKKLPDYLLLINEKNGISNLIEIAESKGVEWVIFNEGIIPEDREKHGYPGTKYSNWIFEYLPDDLQSGYLLAKDLIADAKKRDKKVEIAGISGTFGTNSSMLRVKGLQKAISEEEGVELIRVVPGFYEERRGMEITKTLINYYPDIDIVWCASDLMALGAKKSIEESGRVVGKTISLGGVDWAPFSFDLIEKGELTSSVGGHFLDGGWAMIMLFDYHMGIPLKERSIQSKFSVLNIENIESFRENFHFEKLKAINFKQFSKYYNKDLVGYDFTMNKILNYFK